MTKVTECKLQNGSVPFQNISDSRTREAVMKLSENIIALNKSVNSLAKAIIELQRK